MTDSDSKQTHFTTENPVRIMFPNLSKPRRGMNGQEKFGVLVLLHKDSPELAAVKAAVMAAMDDAFGKQVALKGRFNPIKKCSSADAIRAEEGKQPLFSKLENADEFYYFNAQSNNKPGMVDVELNPLLDQTVFKSGCFVRIAANAYGWDNTGLGVSIGLNHVQFVEAGESLATGGGAASAKEAFAGLGGGVAKTDAGDDDVDALFGG